MVRIGSAQGNDVARVAVVYCRVSTKGQENGTSLATQEARAREHCAKLGLVVFAIHHDTHTGAELDRPGLNAALADIRARRAGVLVAYALDRLSRNQTHQAVILHQVEEQADGRVELVTEQLDATPQGKFLQSALSFMAEVEREKIMERTQRGKRARAERGDLLPGGVPLYGYRWADAERTRVEIDAEAALIVRRIFEELAGGKSVNRIAKELNDAGVPTPSQHYAAQGGNRIVGTFWRRGTIHRILTNPAYKGAHAAYRWQVSKSQRTDAETGETRRVRYSAVRAKDDAARIALPQNACPPIVSAELWETAQRQLTVNWEDAVRHNKRELALLRGGFARCGYCGGKMAAIYNKHRDQIQYWCPRRRTNMAYPGAPCPGGFFAVSTKLLDDAVWERIATMLATPGFLETLVRALDEQPDEARERVEAQIAGYDGTIVAYTRRRTNLLRMLEDAPDEGTYAELKGRVEALAAELARLKGERAKLAAQRCPRGDLSAVFALLNNSALAGAMSADYKQRTFEWPYDTKRHYVRLLGAHATVWRKDDVEHVQPDGTRWKIGFIWTGLNQQLADAEGVSGAGVNGHGNGAGGVGDATDCVSDMSITERLVISP